MFFVILDEYSLNNKLLRKYKKNIGNDSLFL